MNTSVLSMSLIIAGSLMLAGCGKNDDNRQSANRPATADKQGTSDKTASAGPTASDKAANPGPTAFDQAANEADRKITQEIRQKVVEDNSLSTSAHNVTIVSQEGNVTLRGNVKDQKEKEKIADAAKQVAGVKNVDNQLTVAGG